MKNYGIRTVCYVGSTSYNALLHTFLIFHNSVATISLSSSSTIANRTIVIQTSWPLQLITYSPKQPTPRVTKNCGIRIVCDVCSTGYDVLKHTFNFSQTRQMLSRSVRPRRSLFVIEIYPEYLLPARVRSQNVAATTTCSTFRLLTYSSCRKNWVCLRS